MAIVMIISMFPVSAFATEDSYGTTAPETQVEGTVEPVVEEAVEEPAEEPSTEEPAQEPDPAPVEEEVPAEPSEEPAAEPSEEPAAEPSAEPSTEPSTEPAAEPSTEPSTEPEAEPEVLEPVAPQGLSLVLGDAQDPDVALFIEGNFAGDLGLSLAELDDDEIAWTKYCMEQELGYEVEDFMGVKIVNNEGLLMMLGQDDAEEELPITVSGKWLDGYNETGNAVFALMNADIASAEIIPATYYEPEDAASYYTFDADCFLVLMVANNTWNPVSSGDDWSDDTGDVVVPEEPVVTTDDTVTPAEPAVEPSTEPVVEEITLPEGVATWESEADLNGIHAVATIPEGVITEYAKLTILNFSEEAAAASVLSYVNNGAAEGEELQLASLVAADISFTAGGSPVYPNGTAPIRITASSDAIAAMADPRVFHLYNGIIEELGADFDSEAGTVSFYSYAFSPFVIADFAGELPAEEPAPEEEVTAALPEEDVNPMPKATLTQTMDGGVIVTADIPEGALPAGVQMRVAPLDAREALVSVLVSRGYFRTEAKAAIDKLVEEGYVLNDHVGGYNIAFYLPENPEVEIEPLQDVAITYIDIAIAADSQDSLGAYHIGDDGMAEPLNVSVEGENGTFTTTVESGVFSTFPIIDEDILNAIQLAAENEGTRAGGSVDDQIADDAEDLYGEGQSHNPMVTVRVTPSFSGDVMAGDLIEYTIGYTYRVIDTWQNSNEEWITYFKTFNDNKVTIHLPAGLLMPNQAPSEAKFEVDPRDPDNNNLAIDHYYTVWLNVLDPDKPPEPIDPQGSTLNGDFTIKIYVGNNGTAESIHPSTDPYDLPDDFITISTSFDILGEDGTTVLHTYEHDDTATAQDVTTTSPDEWKVEKSPVSAETKVSADGKTATFTWDIEVGLVDSSGIYQLDDKYGRNGRTLLERMTLNDVFDTLLSKGAGSDITGDETVITIKKQTSTTGWGTPVEFDNDDPIVIWDVNNPSSVDTNLVMNSKDLVDSNGDTSLDQNTAKYTKYRVTVSYAVQDPDWIAQFPDAAAYKLTETNTVTITPELARKDHAPVSSTQTQEITLPVAGAAMLHIDKLLTNYLGNEVAYDETLYGPIEYEITAASVFSVYDETGAVMRNTDGSYMSGQTSYKLVSGTTYYLAPGIQYTVKENMTAEQQNVMQQLDNPPYFDHTPAAKEAWNVTFNNKETVGKITITKKDDADRPMTDAATQKAGFTLYANDHTTVVREQVETDGNGQVVFNRLPYGTYWLSETLVPDGYVGMQDAQIVVSAAESNVAYTAKNTQNQSRLTLSKFVGLAEANITNPANTNYPATFTLQRTTDDPESDTAVWTDVPGYIGVTVNAQGKIVADVDAFDSNHNPYYYHFVETIPAGYYDPATGATGPTGTAVSGYVDVVDDEGHAIPKTQAPNIDMYNRKFVRAHINKNFYTVGTNGRTTSTENTTTTVQLFAYTKSDFSDLHPVDDEQKAVGTNTYADWTDLPVYGPDGSGGIVKIHYLVKEAGKYSYILDEAQTGNIVKITTGTYAGTYVEIPMSTSGSTDMYTETEQRAMSKQLMNRQQAIPVILWKKNYYTNSPILNSVKVTIWKVVVNDGTTTLVPAVSAKTEGTSYENVPIQTTNSGTYFYLEPGYKYVFQEVENTSGLAFHSYVNGSASTGALRQEEINGQTYGVIDLSSYTQTYANSNTNKSETRTVNNAPEPNIRINKVDSQNTATSVSGAQFAVYTYNEATERYDPYPDAANQITITTTNADSGVRMPTGPYYFAETVVPENYLDPNVEANYNDYYKGLNTDPANPDTYFWGQTADGAYKTFFKGVVTNNKVGNDNVATFTFKNVKNTGSLKVLKYLDGKLANGYLIQVKDADGNVVKEGLTAGTGTNAGAVTFTDIPVFDDEGHQIEYTITESLTPDQLEACTKASADQTAVLTIGTVTTKDKDGETLAVYNTKRISFTAEKVFRKAFEYDFTHFEFQVEGAIIGLFIKNETTGDWELVPPDQLKGPVVDGQVTNPAATDSNGAVEFDGLIRGKDYVMVELSAGNDYMFPHPFSLTYPPQGVNTTTIAAADLSKYNTVMLSKDVTKDSTETSFPANIEDAKLINSNHWVQFDVTKWLDPRKDIVYEEDGVTPKLDNDGNIIYETHYASPSEVNTPIWPNDEGKLEDGTQLAEVDNVVFKLYRYIMPEGVTSVDFPTTYVPGQGWDQVGPSYTTGTLYVDNVRQIGEFITDSDQNINDHYVYMLVEESVGPNSIVMNPSFKYTFWHEENTSYTVKLVGEASGYTARDKKYKIDTVNFDDILDATPIGPGTSMWYLASVRIAKYQDSYNETSGQLNHDYQPLYGAVFELRLPDGTVIDTMTVGLDSQLSGPEGLSLAQSGTYQLKFNVEDEDGNTHPYAIEDFANEKTYYLDADDVEEFTFTQDVGGEARTFYGYRTLVQLVETGVPDGYSSFLSGGLDMWLCFVNVLKPNAEGQYNGESWVFNDAYFVLTTGTGNTETLADNQSATSWYVTNASSASTIYRVDIGDTENPSKLRIVNYPTTNTMAHLIKYGYTPSADTEGLTAAELDGKSREAIDRVILQGVEMVIQKQNASGGWDYWNYLTDSVASAASAATFTTDEDGRFSFPKGLPEGTYRIYETAIGEGNEAYEMAYPQARARVFTVTKAVVNLSFYNPRMIDMKMIKQDMDGNALSGAVFQLLKGTTVTYTADSSNNYTFNDVASGTYKLVETVAGYSSAYLTQYLAANYPAFSTFATTGTKIGYDYSNTGHTGEYVVSKINPASAILTNPGEFTLTIKNPKLTAVKLLKVDEQNPDTTLQGASFAAFYLPFSALSGDITVNLPTPTEATSTTATAFTDAGWTRVGATYTTNSNGEIVLSNGADPGVYAFYEITPPTGYDLIRNTAGNRILYTAVVTGGIPVNVTVNPSTAAVMDYSGDSPVEKSVQTNWVSTDGTAAQVQAANRGKITLNAKKTVNSGKLVLGNRDEWAITLNLYSDSSKTTKVGTVTINNRTSQGDAGITFKNPSNANQNALFTPGTTYYLEEFVTTPTSNFVLDEVLKDGVTVTIDPDSGMYLFPVESIVGFTITAVNDWLFGKVDFQKVDANDSHKTLTGAEFKVQYNKNAGVEGAEEDWVDLPGATVAEQMSGGEGTGVYTANIPLVSKDARVYRIVETKAPDNYLTEVGKHLDVTLSLKDNVKTITDGLVMTNSEGDALTIVKYDNVKGGVSPSTDTTKATRFAVYHKVDGAWVLEEDGYTNENGVYTYSKLMIPGDEYAIAEVGFDHSSYNRLDGIYQLDGQTETELIPDTTVTFGGKEVDLYVLGTAGSAVQLRAYNVPNIKPIIEKIDVGQYQAGAQYPKNNVQAKTEFAIYEVTAADNLPADPARADVEQFLEAEGRTPIVTGQTDTYDATVLLNGTRGEWNSSDVASRWDNTKTYLLVETNVSAKTGGTYNTMRKDDPRVVWYVLIEPVDNKDLDPENPPVFTLKNIYGDADVTLEKEPIIGGDNNDIYADPDEGNRATIESMLTKSRKVAFTITPTVTSQNQMLDAFVLKETGITAKGIKDANGTIGDVSADYTFTAIEVGSASHVMNPDFGVGDAPVISADVSFYSTTAMAEGDLISTVTVPNVSSNQIVPDIPDGTKAFAISYYSTDVRTATAAMCEKTYSLGEQFNVTPSKVYATMTQLPEGTSDSPVEEVTLITNHSHVDLDYWKWDATGVMEDKPVNKSDDADADVHVKTVYIPKVRVDKVSDPSVTSINNNVVFRLTITNSSESEADFVNPVVLDILPTAVTYVSGSAPASVTSNAGDALTVTTQLIAGKNADTVDEEGQSVSEKESALLFKLNGHLSPGASVTISYTAKVTRSAELFADVVGGSKLLCNDVYLSSAEKVYHTQTNPQGWPFTDENGLYGSSLAEEAASLTDSPSATRREGRMEDNLNDEGNYADGDQYVWLSNTASVTLNKQSRVRLVKAVWGDRDTEQGYHDEKVGVASRTNSRFPDPNHPDDPDAYQEGWVRWRLAVTNGYSDRNIEGLILGDVIPRPGDGEHRLSQWVLNFDTILKIENNGAVVTEDQYTLYFFTGDTADGEQALKNAMSNGDFAGNGFVPASSVSNLSTVTAFIVEFNFSLTDPSNNVVLVPGASLILTYETKVEDVTDDAEFSEIAFRNNSNYFFFYYRNVNEPMQSNTVSVTLTDVPVEIQGDVWIDEDQDGVQGEGNHRDYSQYTIVQKLADALSFSIYDNRIGGGYTSTDDSGTMDMWNGGESIKHFRFDDLGAATTKLGVTEPYKSDGSGDMILDVKGLKGDDPYNYILSAALSDSSLLNIFGLSPLGAGHYMSDDPDSADFVNHTAANFLDNNFYPSGSGYTTSQFYIRYSDNVDQSKDIGFVMFRELELTKLAQDDITVPVSGASFQVFGPFEDSTLGTTHEPKSGTPLYFVQQADGSWALAASTDAGATQTVTTDANGKLRITGLNWWKEYDIAEVEPAAQGYDIAGATATADASVGTQIVDQGDGVFTLMVPSTEKVDPTDKVTVKDPRRVEVQLEVEKILKMYSSEEMTFDFLYWLTTDPNGLNDSIKNTEADPIQTITVTVTGDPDANGIRTAIGSFDPIEVNGAGTYVFSIKEVVVQGSNVQYDTATKTATVVVVWDDTAKKLVVSSITYSDPATVTVDGVEKTYEKFTNEYSSEPTEATPHATKTIAGEEVSYDVSFTFTLTAETVEEKGAYVSGDYDPTAETNTAIVSKDEWSKSLTVNAGDTVGSVDFDAITYVLPGTYTYTIVESATSPDPHFEYSDVKWNYEVVVDFDANGNLEVTSETYTPSKVVDGNAENSNAAAFVNTYTPTPTDWIPQAKKLMTGEPIPEAKKFKFKLTASENNPDGATLPTTTEIEVEVPANATESPIGKFADTVDNVQKGIVFEKAGVYTFQVEEVAGSDGHITYTQAVAVFTVTVEDIDGQLTVTDVGTEGTVDKDGITVTAKFTNTYTVEPTKYKPKVIKRIIGQKTTEAITFTFELAASANNPAGASLTSADDPQTISITIPAGKTGVDYKGEFDWIHFSKAGTFTFTVKEVQPEAGQEIDGVTYDDTVYTLTVEVTDTNGVLSAAASYDPAGYDPDDPETYLYSLFENTYSVTPTEYKPPVEKVVTVDYGPLTEDKTFDFTLTASANNPAGASLTPGSSSSKSITVPAGQTTASTFFDTISFTSAGTYVFEAVEITPADPETGITYSTTVYTLTVEIEDVGSELRVKSAVYSGGTSTTTAQFTNPYKPTPTSYTPPVSKKLTQSSGATTEAKTFNFTMQAYADNPAGATIRVQQTLPDGTKLDNTSLVIPAGSTAEVTAEFGAISFEKAGTYRFLIKEVDDGDPSIDYDPAEWTLTVVVVDNNGVLAIDTQNPPTYVSGSSTSTANAAFTNNYTPKPTDLTLPVKKTLEGNNPPEEVTFTFTLSAVTSGAPMPTGTGNVATVTMTTAGTTKTVNFGKIDYTAAGEYKYKVVETAGTVSGMTYDLAEYEVTVKVTNSGDQLSASYTIKQTKDSVGKATDAAANELLFTNEYKPKPTDAQLHARKQLTGETWPQVYENIVFTFSEAYLSGDLTGFTVADTATMPTQANDAIETVEISGTDAINGKTEDFSKINFTKAGTYKFEIRETKHNPEVAGVTYDLTVWEATIVIADNGSGDLEVASINYKALIYPDGIHNDNVLYAFFTNGYDNGTVPYTPKVTKQVTVEYGPLVAEKTFNFTLTAAEGNPAGASLTPGSVDSVSITIPAGGTNGAANFHGITFTEAGTYTFTAAETKENAAGITYSEVIWTLTVVVTDNGGQLTETHSYSDGTNTVEDAENLPASAGFTNPYKPTPTKYQPKVKKTVPGNELKQNKDFTFTLTLTSQVDAAGAAMTGGALIGTTPMTTDTLTITVPAGSTGAEIEKLFQAISLVKAGTYTFTVSEDATNPYPGFTYDSTVWTLTLVVTDTDGKLEVTSDTYSYTDNDGTHTGTEASFSNPYFPKPVKLIPPVEKTVTVDFGPLVESKIFKFKLEGPVDEHGAPVTSGWSIADHEGLDGTISGMRAELQISAGATNGTANFGAITFETEGTYVFTAKEIEPSGSETNPKEEGITYDDTVWTLTVVVSDDDSGELKLTYNYVTGEDDDQQTSTTAKYTNPYKPKPTTFTIPAKKTVTLKEGEVLEVDAEFKFTLKATTVVADSSYLSSDLATAVKDGDTWEKIVTVPAGQTVGTVSFDEFTYVRAGTYTYTLTEEKWINQKDDDGQSYGVTYDVTEKTIVVTVKDTDGALTIEKWTVNDAAAENVEVANSYEIPRVKVNVEKIWDDVNDQDRIRPESIKVALKAEYTKADGSTVTYYVKTEADGSYTDTTNVEEAYVEIRKNANDKWEHSWDQLPKYRELINEVTYTVEEAKITYIWGGQYHDAPEGFSTGYTTVIAPVTAAAPTEGDAVEAPAQETNSFAFTITNSHEPETMDFRFNKLGEVTTGEEADKIVVQTDPFEVKVNVEPFVGAKFALYWDTDFDTTTWAPRDRDDDGKIVKPRYTGESDTNGIVEFLNVRFNVVMDGSTVPATFTREPATYYMVETDIGDHKDAYWDNDAVYKVVVSPAADKDHDPTVEITVAKPATGTASGAGTGLLVGDQTSGYSIVNMLYSYRLQLIKKDLDTQQVLAGAEFDLYGADYYKPDTQEVNPDAVKIKSLVTDANGFVDVQRLLVGTYYLKETKVPAAQHNHYEYRLLEKPVVITVTKDKVTAVYGDQTWEAAYATVAQTVEEGKEVPHDYTMTVMNKAYGDLVITKTLTTTGPDVASFVFEIKWNDLDGSAQTRYGMITINGGDSNGTITLEKIIPVGTSVTVTEVDTGLQFSYVSGNDTKTIALVNAENATQFDFTNDHDGPGGGHGVVNRFRADENGAPVWKETDPDSGKLPDSNPYSNNGEAQNSEPPAQPTA